MRDVEMLLPSPGLLDPFSGDDGSRSLQAPRREMVRVEDKSHGEPWPDMNNSGHGELREGTHHHSAPYRGARLRVRERRSLVRTQPLDSHSAAPMSWFCGCTEVRDIHTSNL